MAKINLLEPKVFNMIAAGEVVERPSSVVKELVENSIDAGATSVDVYVEEGGIRLIRVSDNGIGILPEDIRAAFLPHATSKLADIEDLDYISTLGFRGEALASIASVSEVTMISAHNSAAHAAKIMLSGGSITFEGADSRNVGTVISVENLFFNTPARLKFLKKPTGELHYVIDALKALALANPGVAFTLSNENGIVLEQTGGTLYDSIYSLYDSKTADKLWAVDFSRSDISVKGFTSTLDFTKPNRTYQTVIVNGRVVSDSTVTAAAEKAYSEYLMKRAYPMFVLDIVLPFDEVDVNVHPSKTEVRFKDKQAVFSAVFHAVTDAVKCNSALDAVGFDIAADVEKKSVSEALLKSETADNRLQNKNVGFVQPRIDTSSLFEHKKAPQGFDSNDFYGWKKAYKNELKDAVSGIYSEAAAQKDTDIKDFTHSLSDTEYKVFDGKIIGQLFDTYIVVERDDLVYIIDQHAAHERILYDKIADNLKAEHSQALLIPYKYKPSGKEAEFFELSAPVLNSYGFEIEYFAGNYLIKAVPEALSDTDFSHFFSELFAFAGENPEELSLKDLLKEQLCSRACKAAIKGGEALGRSQIEYVIKNFIDEDGNLPTKCPHGRPAVITLSKRDIEKLFKRIV